MFGQKNDSSDQDANIPDESIDAAVQSAEQDHNEVVEPTNIVSEDVADDAPPANDAPASVTPPFPLPTPPADNSNTVSDVISPAGGFPSAASDRLKTHGPVLTFSSDDKDDKDDQDDKAKDEDDKSALVTSNDVADAGLVDIKQKALSDLAPLVDQLDQPADEKFRTIMMMIQASDDQSLVEKAYSAAHSIEDEKARAQALLDVVNEINYFTQPPSNDE